MSQFDLEKKAEKVSDFLLKKGVTTIPKMRVAAALDISGSMSGIIARGDLQKALDQLMGAAMRFDDNGELDIFKFDDACEYVGVCTPKDHENYVASNGIRTRGGTQYAPIITAAQAHFFGGKTEKKGGFFGMGAKTVSTPGDNSPVMMLVITDGEPSDLNNALSALKASGADRIYYHFVGIGGTKKDFRAISRMADDFDNVGEVYLPRFGMSDDEVYSQLVTDELVAFLKKHQVT